MRFADLLARYDGFIFDQYGVLHDGSALYPGASKALEACAAAGKPVVMLTNSGRSAAQNAERLAQLGIDPGVFRALITSGDLAAQLLAKKAPKAVYVIARGRVPIQLPVPQVSASAAAQFLVIAGSEADRVPKAHYQALLAPMAARRVPALCANPDLDMLTPAGLCPAPGRIAQWYEQMGGTVAYVGKPWPEIYHAALSALGVPAQARVCCVGDSLRHDILGAQRAGLPGVLVRTGVSAHLSSTAIAEIAQDTGATPSHILRDLL